MESSVVTNDQSSAYVLDAPAEPLRFMAPSEMAVAWARKILETADLQRRERQHLHDMCRVHRADAIDRSAFGTILRYASRAPIAAALYGTELLRVEIVGRGNYVLPPPHIAHEMEERSNHQGNLAQLRHTERRDRSSMLDLADRMGQQEQASRMLAMSEAAALRHRSTFVLASR